MELQHVNHKHTLILHEDSKLEAGQEVSCFECKKPILGSTYSCKNYNFVLHKACAELPHQSFLYRCSLCNFNLDLKCAILPCIHEPKDSCKHQFMMLMESRIPYICDGCDHDGLLDSWAYFCIMCQLLIHSNCHPSMPYLNRKTIKQHVHPFTYTFFLHENEPRNKHNCVIYNYYSCSISDETVQGPNYNYNQLNSLICAKLPREIKHPFHCKHPFILLSESVDLSSDWNYPHYNCCSKRCSRFVYSCYHCEQVYLDFKCATMPCIIDPQAN
ncbi:hypothetical protein Pint_36406 [Pistacia integerrima]|uniref:Uncharacterized protein n=1 Tax=Pistacia integerrima TaxID=434235 RepID=A0ACC0Y0X0_9ROSI|nr:hypothetical protein Pint_36406 [Pistacia integerrima]